MKRIICLCALFVLILLIAGCALFKTDAVSVQEMPFAVSYQEERAKYKSGDAGVFLEGFQNTSPYAINGYEDAVERAKLECTIQYDQIHYAYDEESDIWLVMFSLEGVLGGNQDVYLNSQGITQMIVYGE